MKEDETVHIVIDICKWVLFNFWLSTMCLCREGTMESGMWNNPRGHIGLGIVHGPTGNCRNI